MPDPLSTVTTLINSPPAQLLAGGAVFTGVWGIFKGIEGVLNDNTKLEVAVWLLDLRTTEKVQSWPETFTNVFDRVFGTKMPSWSSFFRSVIVTTASIVLVILGLWLIEGDRPLQPSDLRMMPRLLLSNALPDYLSLLVSRRLMALARLHHRSVWQLFIALAAFGASLICAFAAKEINDHVMSHLAPALNLENLIASVIETIVTDVVVFIAALFPSVWFWLYAGSGFLLKGARRLDIGFRWFNKRFDIEKQPLSSIGLVAGALVAFLYWAAVIVTRLA